MTDIIRLLQDFKIPFRTHGTQISQGWLGISECPFCGKSDYGFGINIESGRCNCWRCSGHSLVDTIKALLGVDYHTAKDIIESYSKSNVRRAVLTQDKAHKATNSFCSYSDKTFDLNDRHRAYLESRNFDPDKLIKMWDLKGTHNIGEYRFRIMAPIMYKAKMVSYTGRDITGKAGIKWKTCKAENEVVPHKHILYGLDHCKSDSCLVVEGPGDVWRMGYNAVSTFGTSFKLEQAMLLCNRFKRVFILYDAEPKAQEQARALGVLLSARRIEVEILQLTECNDPGDLNQNEADDIMKSLFGEP